MPRARFVVHGEVQGVNFRASAVREALRLAVTGRVWNRDDGAVELIAEVSGGALLYLPISLEQIVGGGNVNALFRGREFGRNDHSGSGKILIA